VSVTIRDEIVVLMRSGDGYFDHDRLSLSRLKDIVPAIGDRLTLHVEDEGIATYQVEQRYLIDLRGSDDAHEDACFWTLVVDQIHEEHFFELDRVVRAIYREDFDTTWNGEAIPLSPIDPADELDRDNHDPEYWTFERKEILRKEREARLAAMKPREKD
jgi:hypothetical protein